MRATLAKTQIRIVPGEPPNFEASNPPEERQFQIKVVNLSDQFASFQVAVTAPGMTLDSSSRWYSVTPEICAKKPPGDRTEFDVTIVRSPIATYGTTIPLAVNIYSVEFAQLTATESIELIIDSPNNRPLQIFLPFKNLKVYPGDRLDIPILAYNLSTQRMEVTLELETLQEAIEFDWRKTLLEETRQTIQLEAGESKQVTFISLPSVNPPSRAAVHRFTIEAKDSKGNFINNPPRQVQGSLEVLPYGTVEFDCPNANQVIPRSRQFLKSDRAVYLFKFKNSSNIDLHILLGVFKLDLQTQAELIDTLPLSLEAEQPDSLEWSFARSRPWFGTEQTLRFEAVPVLSHRETGATVEPIQAAPNAQALALKIRPRIPFWVQVCGALLLLLLAALLFVLSVGAHHKDPVNSVRLIGDETAIVSGSSDGTARRWSLSPIDWIFARDRLWPQRPIVSSNQGIRVIQERPQRNGEIAVGFQNGNIQLWNVSPPEQLDKATPLFAEGDRVLDLDFTQDSQFLFSGHGSGQVRRWNLSRESEPPQKLRIAPAIYAIAVIDSDPSLVAVAGQYNQLQFWDWRSRDVYQLQYQVNQPSKIPLLNSQYQYINSLAVDNRNTRLVTADSQGFITVWNIEALKQCFNNSGNFRSEMRLKTDDFGNRFVSVECPNSVQIRQWQASEDGSPIRSIAISENGCYLASVGDEGRVLLWLLNETVDRKPKFEEVQSFSNYILHTVDIRQTTANEVLITSDAPDNSVRIYHHSVRESCPS